MSIQNKNTLKSYFLTGSIPTQDQYADLIDSSLTTTGDSQVVLYNGGNVGINTDPNVDPGYTLSVNGAFEANTATFNNISVLGTANYAQQALQHLIGGGNAPIGSPGPAMGTGASQVVFQGTDLAGVVMLQTGTNTGAGAIFQIQFNSVYTGRQPFPVFYPANAAAALLEVNGTTTFVDANQVGFTGFPFTFVGNPLQPNTQYRWFYHIIG